MQNMLKISVAYTHPLNKRWLKLQVAEDCTVLDAIKQSGILEQCPEIDLETQKVGVYGRFIKLDAGLKDGDRIEIYRPITADPKKVKRRDEED